MGLMKMLDRLDCLLHGHPTNAVVSQTWYRTFEMARQSPAFAMSWCFHCGSEIGWHVFRFQE